VPIGEEPLYRGLLFGTQIQATQRFQPMIRTALDPLGLGGDGRSLRQIPLNCFQVVLNGLMRHLLRLQMLGHEVDERPQFGRDLTTGRPENIELIGLGHPLVQDGHETAVSDLAADRKRRQAIPIPSIANAIRGSTAVALIRSGRTILPCLSARVNGQGRILPVLGERW